MGNTLNIGEEKQQVSSDEVREFPRVAQLSSDCEVRDGQAHLPGPSLAKCLRTGADVQQVQDDEARKTPRVVQLSSACEVREEPAHLPGPAWQKE